MGKKSKKKNKDKKAKRCSKPCLEDEPVELSDSLQKQQVESKIQDQLATLRESMNKLKRQENAAVLAVAQQPVPDNAPQAKKRQNLKQTTPALKESSLDEPPKEHICEQCQTPFISESLLQNHMKQHKEKKVFQCTYCNVICDNMPKLKRHMVTHTGERPFKCDICEKTFGLEWNMKLHRRTHTNEKPYKCFTCGKQFAQRTNLKMHGKAHGHCIDSSQQQSDLLSSLGTKKAQEGACTTQMTSYYRKKLEQYRQQLMQNKKQQNAQILDQEVKEVHFRSQGGLIEHPSRQNYLMELCQGIRSEIAGDVSAKCELSQQVQYLSEQIDRDYAAELAQIQSYQGLLAKLFELDQHQMDALRIQTLCLDRQERLIQTSRRALGQYSVPDELVQRYILEIKTEDAAPTQRLTQQPEIKQEQ